MNTSPTSFCFSVTGTSRKPKWVVSGFGLSIPHAGIIAPAALAGRPTRRTYIPACPPPAEPVFRHWLQALSSG